VCACGWVAVRLFVSECVCVCVYVCMHVRVRLRMHLCAVVVARGSGGDTVVTPVSQFMKQGSSQILESACCMNSLPVIFVVQ